MSLSQQAILRYTSSQAVTVIASMILGMKRASRGISLIPITNSCKGDRLSVFLQAAIGDDKNGCSRSTTEIFGEHSRSP